MASRVKVLQPMAGQSYGKAEKGEIMIWPDGSDLDSLVESGMVKVIGKERGVSNMIKPYLVNAQAQSGAVYTRITKEQPITNIFNH